MVVSPLRGDVYFGGESRHFVATMSNEQCIMNNVPKGIGNFSAQPKIQRK
jgi:hypothetical protein